MHPNLESAVAETADRVGSPSPDLRVATNRTSGTNDPVRFLSGASLTPAEVGRYAVARRVDFDGDELTADDVAARISAEETVGYLIAGPGEGKSTYLHALCSSLMSRAIVFRWPVTGQLDWQKLQDFRVVVASLDATGSLSELPIVIVGELATKLAREKEDALIEIVQGIPSGLAPSRTSLVLAGRPAWLNRIRYHTSVGYALRLVPLCGAEAELLIKNLADAHAACCQDKGPAWTEAQFPKGKLLQPFEDPGGDPFIAPVADRAGRAGRVGNLGIGRTEDQDLDQLVEHDPIGDPGPMTAQRVGHLAFGEQHGELVPDRPDDGRWQRRHKHLVGKTSLDNP